MSRFEEAKLRIAREVSRRIEKYGLPRSWEKECCDLYEEFLKSHDHPHVGKRARLIDSILLLLCRKKRFIEPRELVKATRGGRGASARKSLHFFRILEALNGLTPATPDEYTKKFFVDNPEYEEFKSKALDLVSKLPSKFQSKSPRVLAAVCIYVSSIGTIYGKHRPLITKREVATYFKVTEMGITYIYRELLPKLKDMNTMLSEEEVVWLLSFRKERLERIGAQRKEKSDVTK